MLLPVPLRPQRISSRVIRSHRTFAPGQPPVISMRQRTRYPCPGSTAGAFTSTSARLIHPHDVSKDPLALNEDPLAPGQDSSTTGAQLTEEATLPEFHDAVAESVPGSTAGTVLRPSGDQASWSKPGPCLGGPSTDRCPDRSDGRRLNFGEEKEDQHIKNQPKEMSP